MIQKIYVFNKYQKVTKIQPMYTRQGNYAKNQHILHTKQGRFFKSYNSIIAFISNKGKVYLDKKYWDYSQTTSNYRNQFLQEGINDTRKNIKNNTYTLTNLN